VEEAVDAESEVAVACGSATGVDCNLANQMMYLPSHRVNAAQFNPSCLLIPHGTRLSEFKSYRPIDSKQIASYFERELFFST
jgi:hypothetical protein